MYIYTHVQTFTYMYTLYICPDHIFDHNCISYDCNLFEYSETLSAVCIIFGVMCQSVFVSEFQLLCTFYEQFCDFFHCSE